MAVLRRDMLPQISCWLRQFTLPFAQPSLIKRGRSCITNGPSLGRKRPEWACERPEVQPTCHINNDAPVRREQQHGTVTVPNIPSTSGL